MSITIKPFGRTMDGRESARICLVNSAGIRVELCDFGAMLCGLHVPDDDGLPADIVLGFDQVGDYEVTEYYMGATIGRHAGQVKNGVFSLGGRDYHLVINDHDHTMHGGPMGFHRRYFQWLADSDEVVFLYRSPDGECGFPGNLDVRVRYHLSEDGALTMEFSAKCDKDTILNMTNHSYFNLDGAGAGGITEHSLQIFAGSYTEVDAQGLPTGKISPVKDSPYDFTTARRIGERIGSADQQLGWCKGYDHNWVLSEKHDGVMRKACELHSSNGKRRMQIQTNQPGIQMYSGNYLTGREKGKSGMAYLARSALCLEPQLFPNGMSHQHFPSPILRAGEEYRYISVYTFR